ncbi:MAG: tRNA glutamyl-Q(34) synthetase GluQRS [Burkholderiales bacterium]
MAYIGRFAPSPTGPLHAGSLVAALASWLDARAHSGRWLVRIEDVDTPRCVPGAAEHILVQLAACGLVADEAPVWQSRRGGLYQAALDRLIGTAWAYPCGCTRNDIEQVLRSQGHARTRHHELVYPGTCRGGLHGKPARATRLLAAVSPSEPNHAVLVDWHDRRLGAQQQDLTNAVGDFVLKRADGLWAYQLAVVADDAAQGVTHVVRGEDLAHNTPRQIHLQRCLGHTTPAYLHAPLVLGPNGEKLSKQNGALALALEQPLLALREAGAVLGVCVDGTNVAQWLAAAVEVWRKRWPT